MNTLPESALNIQDMPRVLSKYWVSIFITTLACTALSFFVANHLPKKYKTHFVLTIYSKYFQSPLVGDFIPNLSESSEARSQRESLIRQVLTPEYLDSLGSRYGLYGPAQSGAEVKLPFNLKTWADAFGLFQPGSKDSEQSAERQDLRERISIESLNSTTFQIGFVYSDPAVTLQVTQDIYNRVIQNLLETRMRILTNIRDAIQHRVASLAVAASAPEGTSAPTGEQTVAQELASVRAQIRSMSSQYTDEHPLMVQLRERERILASRALGHDRSMTEGRGESARDMYGDLSKKLNYLNIAIDSDHQHESDYFATLEPPQYPSTALGPRKALLGLWGAVLGFFGALFISAIREYFDRSTLHAAELAHQLNLPLLGELPSFPSKATR